PNPTQSRPILARGGLMVMATPSGECAHGALGTGATRSFLQSSAHRRGPQPLPLMRCGSAGVHGDRPLEADAGAGHATGVGAEPYAGPRRVREGFVEGHDTLAEGRHPD